jgi:hypothetical protein
MRVTVTMVILLELTLTLWIRDSLVLNVVMLTSLDTFGSLRRLRRTSHPLTLPSPGGRGNPFDASPDWERRKVRALSGFQPTGSIAGADVLYDLYGIGYGFSGLGFAVKNSFLAGQSVALTAGQALEQSVVPEYLLNNVTLSEGNCRCIRVKPYAGRDQGLLNWGAVTAAGNQNLCTPLTSLP